MKKKLLSILLCICMCIGFLTGCTLVETDNSHKDSEVVMTVGTTEITRKELVEQYYSFYNQYYQYFMYYDSDTMMDLFYSSVENRAIVLQEANTLLSDTSGKFKFVDDDYDKIWYDVFDYVDGRLDTIEKALRLQAGSKEEDLPEWLASKEDEETAYKYTPYESEKIEAIDYTSQTAAVEPEFATKLNELKTQAIYRYNVETDDEKPRDEKEITADDDKVYRDLAMTRYIESLMISAKADGKNHDSNIVLEEEIRRLYKSYYETALYNKYSEYIENNGIITDGLLSNKKIANKFIELTNKDNQAYASEESYVKIITDSKNESLILYHNGGEYTYFTVQHILFSFDDATIELLKEHEGYTDSVDAMIRAEYEKYREQLAGTDQYGNVNYSNMTSVHRDPNTGLNVTVQEGSGEDVKTVNQKLAVSEIITRIENSLSGLSGREKALEFYKLSWIYSNDTGSLKDSFSSKVGMTISSKDDDHGSFVSDFAEGARELYSTIATDGIAGKIKYQLSDYGLHLIMITNVYESGKVVETTKLDGNAVVERTEDEIVNDLKATYVSNTTEQTLYDYIYDMLRDELVGSNGTYFVEHRNKLVSEYKNEGKIVYSQKLSYQELSKAVGL